MSAGPVSVRPLREADLDRADEIFRAAFGTFLSGIPDPFGTADYVHTRFAADPQAAFAATVEVSSPDPTSPPTGAASGSSAR